MTRMRRISADQIRDHPLHLRHPRSYLHFHPNPHKLKHIFPLSPRHPISRDAAMRRALPLLLVLIAPQLQAADLSKIEHTIRKEPAYHSKTPRYCLLVFGPEAKTHVWLVLDGKTLYVDRNGNGDLTEEGEKVTAIKGIDFLNEDIFEIGEIHAGEGHSIFPGSLATVPQIRTCVCLIFPYMPQPHRFGRFETV